MASSVVRAFEHIDVLASGLTDTDGVYLFDTEGAYLIDTPPTLVGGAVAGVVPSVLSQGSRAVLVDPKVAGATVIRRLAGNPTFPVFIVGDALQGRVGRNRLTAPLLELDSGTLGLLNTNVLDS